MLWITLCVQIFTAKALWRKVNFNSDNPVPQVRDEVRYLTSSLGVNPLSHVRNWKIGLFH